jgi:DNA repair photolyase
MRNTGQVTAAGRPITWYVDQEVNEGRWREEEVAAEIVGLTRPLTIFRGPRKTGFIAYDWHGDKATFCPPMWWDLAIGSGACGLGCRSCFLMLTHRIKRDPMRHVLYDNIPDFVHAAEKWLRNPARRRQHTLGVGIDRSDSLLYEGVTGQVRSLAPLFANPMHNPLSNRLILLTKSANTGYLAEVAPEHRSNIVASFSLNPEPVADLWEGKWPDTGERITPFITHRLQAVRYAQDLGYEVRVRVDPILTPPGWQDLYAAFISEVRAAGITFAYWTLGTYREKNSQLDAWRERWGLPAMEWQPAEGELVQDGTHRHLSEAQRVAIYTTVRDLIRGQFPQARVSLCKETHGVRKAVALCNADCNCLR